MGVQNPRRLKDRESRVDQTQIMVVNSISYNLQHSGKKFAPLKTGVKLFSDHRTAKLIVARLYTDFCAWLNWAPKRETIMCSRQTTGTTFKLHFLPNV